MIHTKKLQILSSLTRIQFSLIIFSNCPIKSNKRNASMCLEKLCAAIRAAVLHYRKNSPNVAKSAIRARAASSAAADHNSSPLLTWRMLAGLDVAAAALPLVLIALLFFWIRRRYFSTRTIINNSSSSATINNEAAAATANQEAPKKTEKQSSKRSKTKHHQQQHKFEKLPLSEANENKSRTPASPKNQTKPNIHLPIFHDQNENPMTQEIKLKKPRSKMAANSASSESDEKSLTTGSQRAINGKHASLSETSLSTTSTKNSPIHQEANWSETRVEKQKSVDNSFRLEESSIIEPTAANKTPTDINCNNNHLDKMSILASSLKYSSVRLLKVECEARSLRLQTSSLQAALDTAKGELESLKMHNGELQGFEKLLNNKQSEILELKSMINENFSQQNSNNDTIREQHKLIKNFETKIASMKFENQALISAKQTMEQELHNMNEKNKEIQAKLFETRQQLHQTRAQINGKTQQNPDQSDIQNCKRTPPGFGNLKILDIISYILLKTQSIDQKEKRELVPELFDRLDLSSNSSERLRMQSLFTPRADEDSIVSKIDENLRHTLDKIVLINQNILNSTLNSNRDSEHADAIELLNKELKLAALPVISSPLSASNRQSSMAEWCAEIKNLQNQQTPVQSAPDGDNTLDYCGLRRQFLTDIVFEFANYLGVDIAQLPMPCSNNTSTTTTDADSHMKDWVCKLAVAIREN